MLSRFRMLSISALLLIAVFVSASAAQPREIEQGYPGIRLELLLEGLGVPWGMTFLSPRQLLITERQAALHLLDLERLTHIRVSGLPRVAVGGQGGLLDVAVGPNFNRDGWIYFTYSKAVGTAAATTLARARITRQSLVDWQDLLVTDSATNSGQHFGSRIAFDHQGHVFFGIGDRGNRKSAQDLSNHIGTIVRLNLDGSLPPDNPFIGNANARDEIWSFGHRNPQGLLYDTSSRRLWSIEHGPRGGDEINLIHKGRNYGWPVISHGKEYWGPVSIGEGRRKSGMEAPLKVYIPSIAPGSLMLYRGNAFPQWRGNLFAGALKLQHINRVTVSASNQLSGEERLLENLKERIRHLTEGPDGWIYLTTDSGKIMRLVPE